MIFSMTRSTNAFDNYRNLLPLETLRQITLQLHLILQTKHLIAAMAMKMRMQLLLVKRMARNCIFGGTVLQNNLMNSTHFFQRFQGAVKRNPIEKPGERIFQFIFGHCRAMLEKFGKNKFPTTCILQIVSLQNVFNRHNKTIYQMQQ